MPVLVSDGCETPLVLQDSKPINMRHDFYKGIIDLLFLLKKRKEALASLNKREDRE